MHNKKGASPLPLRLTEVRPSTRMYRNRTWEHTPNGVYPQHPFPDIHLIGRFQLRANSGKYHFKTKIAKSVRFPKKRGHQRQKSCSGRSRRATGSLHRNAVRGYGGAGCGMRGEGAKRSEGAKERRSEGAKERRSEEEPTRGYRRARRCTGLEECQCRCRCRCRRGRGRGAWGQKSADAGLRKVSLQGSEERRCKPGAGAGAGAGTEGREGRGGGKTNRRGAQKSVGTGAGAGADRTGPSGQRLRTRRPRRRARPTV